MVLYSIYFYILLFLSLFMYLLSLFIMNAGLECFFEYGLLSLNSCLISMIFYIDWVALMFVSFVLFISSMIIKYSLDYMSDDSSSSRFLYLMLLFIASMMMVILSPNLISILLGWDGLGLVSYALVIYYQNSKSYNAGMLTALSNRIGDAAILLGIAFMMHFSSWNFMNYLEFLKSGYFMMVISLLVVLASITKSAQIPFSSWLPAAMAAPTPVSSLVHSSTLVTAGVYLLFRFSFMFTDSVMKFLLYCSLLTMFMAGLCANFDYDLKKIIAFSTLSQLGMMLFILSLGEASLVIFHLLVHALFKALLFMSAGLIIHSVGNKQDIRSMGGLGQFLPITCGCMGVSSSALCGLPFLSGFYSKDLIAEVFSMSVSGYLIYLLFFVSIGLTVAYSLRLIYYLFLSSYKGSSINMIFESANSSMIKGMLGLVILVIFKGSMMAWLIFPEPYFILLPFYMKMFTLIMIFVGVVLGYEVSFFNYVYMLKSIKFYGLVVFTSTMWNMPVLSTYGVNEYVLKMGKIYKYKFDMGWLEYYGSMGLFSLLLLGTKFLQNLFSGHVKLFMFLVMILMGVLITKLFIF